ncbi:hypothetical protein [Paraclostridium bifermentans]|nr:hypothetical protein [Paraclostridium bifermentans]MDO7204244.1 hypothetical protein [Paraclostridium bifermentans]
MLDQNTDRSGWAMAAIVVVIIVVALATKGTNTVGDLLLDKIVGIVANS